MLFKLDSFHLELFSDWALGGAALGLTVALVEFIANSVVEVPLWDDDNNDNEDDDDNQDDDDDEDESKDYDDDDEVETERLRQDWTNWLIKPHLLQLPATILFLSIIRFVFCIMITLIVMITLVVMIMLMPR